MIVEKKIINEKLHSDVNKQTVKILALSSEKIGKEVTGEELLQTQIIEQAKFIYSPLNKCT